MSGFNHTSAHKFDWNETCIICHIRKFATKYRETACNLASCIVPNCCINTRILLCTICIAIYVSKPSHQSLTTHSHLHPSWCHHTSSGPSQYLPLSGVTFPPLALTLPSCNYLICCHNFLDSNQCYLLRYLFNGGASSGLALSGVRSSSSLSPLPSSPSPSQYLLPVPLAVRHQLHHPPCYRSAS